VFVDLRGRVVIPIVLPTVATQQASTASNCRIRSFRFTEASVRLACGPWDLAPRQVLIKIPELRLQFFERRSLCPIVRMILQITQPLVLLLPIDVLDRFHVSHYSGKRPACKAAGKYAVPTPRTSPLQMQMQVLTQHRHREV
jgi:hypothetical protein